ncbi:NADP-dependent oxidoreductase domain-containing protein [Aspergillus stella-maris]|uniref:NADP-dependent oxidoreductase domain-containing protein n=1 Tax=Aspergillus stella-maris TaxID=1810926 RepID=UPI003CCD6C75
MEQPLPIPERTTIAGDIEVPHIISGLWQLAGGHDAHVNIETAAAAMNPLLDAGLNCFDMADHYGDAELVIGAFDKSTTSKRPITAFTKWCPPETGERSFSAAEVAVDRALERMNQTSIPLLHALQKTGKIKHIGLTNTDAAHLQLFLDSGIKIASNQVSCSVIDRRLVRGRLGDVCMTNGVSVLAYGTLLGGFLSEKWLGKAEPDLHDEGLNWSLKKYLRFIHAAGGWDVFQSILSALHTVAQRHSVSISAVATRYVLDLPPVSAVIVGSRLSEGSEGYIARNLMAFSFSLTEGDRGLIAQAQERLIDVPGDCGDEYRRKPFLTAKGDLSDHLDPGADGNLKVESAVREGKRVEFDSGSVWEGIAGYSRAIRTGNTIRVSGTTANSPVPAVIPVLGGSSAASQTVAILDGIARAVKALGGRISDIVWTRIMVANEKDCEAVSRAHGWFFKCERVRPANTLIKAGLIGSEFLVEIEAEAEVGVGSDGVLRV